MKTRGLRKGLHYKLGRIMQCFCSGEQVRGDEMVPHSESHAAKEYSASVRSSRTGETERRADTGNIEEAEISLRESSGLNYEEARALLGRYEYQKGNIEAALHVFEGIGIASVTPKIKRTLAKKRETHKRHSQNYGTPPMSIHAASLLLEAIFLKAKSLQALGRHKEAAQSCSVILDIVESSLPAGLPENFGADCKLLETLNKAVELHPELWNLADCPSEAILSYRRALLNHGSLDAQTTANIQKDFAIFLLYSGTEAIPPNLGSQRDSAFVPRNNIEEAILLFIVLLRKVSLKIIQWDPSILDHLCYGLSISGGLRALAGQVEELLPGIIDRKEMHHVLALCYHAEGDDMDAMELWKKMLKLDDCYSHLPALLFSAKICGESSNYVADGLSFARRAVKSSQGTCNWLMGVAYCMLGISLSTISRLCINDSERVEKQSEALNSFEIAGRMTNMKDPAIVYRLCLENAEQRKLDAALHQAKGLVSLEAGSNLRGWILLARILSAQKCFVEGETIVNVALGQTGVWDQQELFRIKAKLQLAQGLLKETIETYSQLFAVLHVQRKSLGSGKNYKERRKHISDIEQETWHDLASIYMRLSQWHDAELCLSKSAGISAYSASRLHAAGQLHEARGQQKEALRAYETALEVEPKHAPSLVSQAVVLRRLGCQSPAIIRTLLTEALKLDTTNALAWYNLGLLYKDNGISSAMEAAECFQAAILLEETEPIEPFR